jgi:phosphate/sulfate permease
MQIFVALVSAILSAFISALVVHYITEYFDKEKDAKIKDRKAAKGTKSENRLSKKIDFTSLFF